MLTPVPRCHGARGATDPVVPGGPLFRLRPLGTEFGLKIRVQVPSDDGTVREVEIPCDHMVGMLIEELLDLVPVSARRPARIG